MNRSILFIAAFGLLATPYIQAEDYSDAITFRWNNNKSKCVSSGRSYHPVNECETGTGDVSEEELLLQLDPASRQIYYMLSEEGKGKARELASDNYRYDKNHAVKAAREMTLRSNGAGQADQQPAAQQQERTENYQSNQSAGRGERHPTVQQRRSNQRYQNSR